MSGAELFLLAMIVAVAASVGVVFLLYRNELGRTCEAARQGSLVANTDAGPIEYAQKGAGISLISIHGPGGGFDQGFANLPARDPCNAAFSTRFAAMLEPRIRRSSRDAGYIDAPF